MTLTGKKEINMEDLMCLVPKWKAGQIVTLLVKGELKQFRITKSEFGHSCETCRKENHHPCILGLWYCAKQMGMCRYPKPLRPKQSMSCVVEKHYRLLKVKK